MGKEYLDAAKVIINNIPASEFSEFSKLFFNLTDSLLHIKYQNARMEIKDLISILNMVYTNNYDDYWNLYYSVGREIHERDNGIY